MACLAIICFLPSRYAKLVFLVLVGLDRNNQVEDAEVVKEGRITCLMADFCGYSSCLLYICFLLVLLSGCCIFGRFLVCFAVYLFLVFLVLRLSVPIYLEGESKHNLSFCQRRKKDVHVIVRDIQA